VAVERLHDAVVVIDDDGEKVLTHDVSFSMEAPRQLN
jgi:hypothetical protein